ncbi:JAB domain-containing protein [Polaribacter sp. MSW13]|uniref:JAB domain-containing protein n=1 Tax=Polaribacter marinus TaxID=2916838 RepID=A0A9X2AMM1_9FLAO|nr:JAB domain-containing protein [Polaribacter marinus]MCI2230325.1 JAB domain-containing protein [Polaribacter marinus]
MKTLPSIELLGSSYIEIHYQRPHQQEMHHISCAKDADEILRKYINPKQLDLRECFWVILLTNANRVLSVSEISQGTSRGVLTNPKYIFQLALLTNASAIIVAHNHPSGNLNFSKRDISETKKIKRLATLMDITLLDHIIITSESFVSMAEEDEL